MSIWEPKCNKASIPAGTDDGYLIPSGRSWTHDILTTPCKNRWTSGGLSDLLPVIGKSLCWWNFVTAWWHQAIPWTLVDIVSVRSSDIDIREISQNLTEDKQTLVQVMRWCHQATCHYLNQCWQRSMIIDGITGPQWIKMHQPCHRLPWAL